MSWSLHSPLSLIVKLERYILPYLYLGVIFCCFGLLHEHTNNQIFIPQAFEANASSSGGTQTLIEWNFNQDYKTIKSEVIHQKEESGVLTPTFKQTKLRQWLFWIVLDHPDFHFSRLLSYHCYSNSPGSSCQDLSFPISFLVLGTY